VTRLTAALSLAAWCAAWAGAAAAARFAWVEHTATAARCDGGGGGLVCTLRSAVIQAFIHDRLGSAALALAALAAGLAWWRAAASGSRMALALALALHRAQRTLMLAALATSSAGLWLYAAPWAAPALLLAVAVWAGEDTDQIAALAASASKTPA
jgi:hypothetical protein